jgi:hypothetical protein
MEKMRWRLARLYVGRGHQVTLISRRWSGWPEDETVDGVHLLRVAGLIIESAFGRCAPDLWTMDAEYALLVPVHSAELLAHVLRDAMVRETPR